MAIISKLKYQHKHADIVNILKELEKKFNFSDISEDYLKIRIYTKHWTALSISLRKQTLY